jgi:hypothetical protein
MTAPSLASRAPESAANRRQAASSVTPVASGYARSAEAPQAEAHCLTWFSPIGQATCERGGL